MGVGCSASGVGVSRDIADQLPHLLLGWHSVRTGQMSRHVGTSRVGEMQYLDRAPTEQQPMAESTAERIPGSQPVDDVDLEGTDSLSAVGPRDENSGGTHLDYGKLESQIEQSRCLIFWRAGSNGDGALFLVAHPYRDQVQGESLIPSGIFR